MATRSGASIRGPGAGSEESAPTPAPANENAAAAAAEGPAGPANGPADLRASAASSLRRAAGAASSRPAPASGRNPTALQCHAAPRGSRAQAHARVADLPEGKGEEEEEEEKGKEVEVVIEALLRQSIRFCVPSRSRRLPRGRPGQGTRWPL
jgi:hypothetical protein